MAEHALFPAYGDVRYHSLWGVHHALVPTREWFASPLIPGNVLGQYTNWSTAPCDGEAMWDEFVLRWKPFFPATVTLDSITIYTKATLEATAIPRAVKAYGAVGTEADAGWSQAVERTWLMRDTEFFIAKSVMLDAQSGNNFGRIADISGSAESVAYFGMLSALGWAFQSRAGFRVATFQSLTTGLNDKLRRSYGIA